MGSDSRTPTTQAGRDLLRLILRSRKSRLDGAATWTERILAIEAQTRDLAVGRVAALPRQMVYADPFFPESTYDYETVGLNAAIAVVQGKVAG